MSDVLCIIYELKEYKNWVPMMNASDIVHQFTDFQICSQIGITMPWPIKNRCLYLNVAGVVDKDIIHIGMRSNPLSTYLDGKEFEKDLKKNVEVDVDNAAWFI